MVRQAMWRFARKLLALSVLGAMVVPAVAQVETVVLPDQPADQHWVWVTNLQFGHYNKSVLYNADTGEVLGSVDMGWEGMKQEFPRSKKELYSAAVYLSRGFRGTRTDVIGVFDKNTLMPLREIIIPTQIIKGWPDPTLTALSDDDAFMYVQGMAPGSSVGVADMKNNKFGSEIETSGCAHIMAAGNRRFVTLCGDGSLLAVTIDDTGREVSRKRYPGFFDADHDLLHGSGFRSGNVWYFVSHHGTIHSVDVSGAEPKFLPTWKVATPQGDKTWIPGAFMQSVAVNERLGRLYVAMQLSDLKPKYSGPAYHAQDGTEVWAFDLASKKVVQKYSVPAENPISHLAVSQDAKPLIYAGSVWSLKVVVLEEKTGKHLRDFFVPEMPTIIQPVQ